MTGSLQKVKNKRGELVWRVQWREQGGWKSRIVGTVREMSRADADAARRAIVAPFNVGKPARSIGVTVAAYVRDEYLTSRSAFWKRSTELTTTSLIELYILGNIGGRLLADVTRADLQSLLNDLAAVKSKSIVSHVRFQLKAIYELAIGDRRVIGNPTSGLKTPRAAAGRVAPEIGSAEAISKAIMDLAVRDRLFLALASWRGMRPGEIAALQVGDVRADFIHIERRVYCGIIDGPKTETGRRKVALGSLAELVTEHLATLPDISPEAWMFPSETGKTPISYSNLYRRRLKPALEAAGLKRFNYQAMRATFATIYGTSEPDAKVRADAMGHTVDVHEHVYRQATDEQRRESMRLLEGKLQ